ncbi:MAG: DUF418 domain-containing protein [Alphaproteobacteria bacterium]|nr:MAG: DUF418 domain-containing protein [Alphaproteobacteria bacterium]
MNPILSHERVHLLDVLRGLAIFGMFTVNMTVDSFWADTYRTSELASLDFIALVLVDLFAKGKFITIFSFLFGIGFFVQMERASARGVNATAFYIRRSTGLLIIGVLGLAFTLNSWILVDYAIFGLGLLLFLNRSPRTILMAGIALILLANIFGWIIPDYLEQLENPALVVEQTAPEGAQPTSPTEMSEDAVLREGDFLQISSYGLLHLWEAFTDWRYYASELRLLGIMLLGLYVARLGAVWDSDVRRVLARKALPWLIAIGFSGCLVWVVMADFGVGDKTSAVYLILPKIAAWPIGMPMLGLGYAVAIALLIEREKWRKWLMPMAAVGRMALTNYLFTALIAAFIGFSWGLGLYGKISVSQSLLLVLIIFPIQVLASRWWMARYVFGPAEWLWRSFTYGKLQPMYRTDVR